MQRVGRAHLPPRPERPSGVDGRGNQERSWGRAALDAVEDMRHGGGVVARPLSGRGECVLIDARTHHFWSRDYELIRVHAPMRGCHP